MNRDDRFQAALDGELSGDEANRLQSECDAQPEARQHFEALKQADLALKGLKQHDAPPQLEEQVMRQVRLRQAVNRSPNRAGVSAFGEWWQSWFGKRPAFQVGLGFALGVLLLLPLTEAPWRHAVDPQSVTGTMATPGDRQAEPLRFQTDGIVGSLAVRTQGEVLTLDMRLASPEPAVVKFDFSAPIAGLASFVSTAPATSKLEYSEQTLSLWHLGEGHVEINVYPGVLKSPKLHFSVLQNGIAVYEADVH